MLKSNLFILLFQSSVSRNPTPGMLTIEEISRRTNSTKPLTTKLQEFKPFTSSSVTFFPLTTVLFAHFTWDTAFTYLTFSQEWVPRYSQEFLLFFPPKMQRQHRVTDWLGGTQGPRIESIIHWVLVQQVLHWPYACKFQPYLKNQLPMRS